MAKRMHEIRDPVHTFVHFDSRERDLINSRPFQRLRHIHQIGMSHLVYPGGNHTHFERSLGVMEPATIACLRKSARVGLSFPGVTVRFFHSKGAAVLIVYANEAVDGGVRVYDRRGPDYAIDGDYERSYGSETGR